MDRMLYVAMTGAKESLLAQGSVNHNMANANTPGFLADLQQFRSMPVYGDGYPTRVYAMSEQAATDTSHGSTDYSGRDLDVAVKGDGWIAVQAPDGNEAYTRRGDLQVDASGRLTTGEGLPVIGNSGPIALPPYDKLEIGSDGSVSIRPQGAATDELAVVDRIKLVSSATAELEKGADGLMRTKSGQAAPADASQRVVSGALTSSNVDMVGEMVSMIELSRRFELQVQMMKTAEQTAASSSTLLKPV
jgi:flagellar basal-body rod protein FlgF